MDGVLKALAKPGLVYILVVHSIVTEGFRRKKFGVLDRGLVRWLSDRHDFIVGLIHLLIRNACLKYVFQYPKVRCERFHLPMPTDHFACSAALQFKQLGLAYS